MCFTYISYNQHIDRFFAERLLQHHGSIAMTRPPESYEDLLIYDDNADSSESTNDPLKNSSSNSIISPPTNVVPNDNNSFVDGTNMGEVNIPWGMARMNNHLATMAAAALPSLHHFDALQRSFRCA